MYGNCNDRLIAIIDFTLRGRERKEEGCTITP
jgi:hypothetical protein